MFKFRLEKILNLKMKMEDAKKNEFAKAKKRLEDVEAKKEQLIAKKNGMVEEMKKLNNSITELRQRNDYNNYIKYLKEVIEKLEKNLELLRRDVEIKRHELEEAVKERKILDKLKEKELEKYKKEELQLANAMVNELVSYKYTGKEEE